MYCNFPLATQQPKELILFLLICTACFFPLCSVSRDVFEAEVLRELSLARPLTKALALNTSSTPTASPGDYTPLQVPLNQVSLPSTSASYLNNGECGMAVKVTTGGYIVVDVFASTHRARGFVSLFCCSFIGIITQNLSW